jgi:hypothetical protein
MKRGFNMSTTKASQAATIICFSASSGSLGRSPPAEAALRLMG